jgi:hypothetical protein
MGTGIAGGRASSGWLPEAAAFVRESTSFLSKVS